MRAVLRVGYGLGENDDDDGGRGGDSRAFDVSGGGDAWFESLVATVACENMVSPNPVTVSRRSQVICFSLSHARAQGLPYAFAFFLALLCLLLPSYPLG